MKHGLVKWAELWPGFTSAGWAFGETRTFKRPKHATQLLRDLVRLRSLEKQGEMKAEYPTGTWLMSFRYRVNVASAA